MGLEWGEGGCPKSEREVRVLGQSRKSTNQIYYAISSEALGIEKSPCPNDFLQDLKQQVCVDF